MTLIQKPPARLSSTSSVAGALAVFERAQAAADAALAAFDAAPSADRLALVAEAAERSETARQALEQHLAC